MTKTGSLSSVRRHIAQNSTTDMESCDDGQARAKFLTVSHSPPPSSCTSEFIYISRPYRGHCHPIDFARFPIYSLCSHYYRDTRHADCLYVLSKALNATPDFVRGYGIPRAWSLKILFRLIMGIHNASPGHRQVSQSHRHSVTARRVWNVQQTPRKTWV